MTKQSGLEMLQDIIENIDTELKPIPEPQLYTPPFDYIISFLIKTGLPVCERALHECMVTYTKENKSMSKADIENTIA